MKSLGETGTRHRHGRENGVLFASILRTPCLKCMEARMPECKRGQKLNERDSWHSRLRKMAGQCDRRESPGRVRHECFFAGRVQPFAERGPARSLARGNMDQRQC